MNIIRNDIQQRLAHQSSPPAILLPPIAAHGQDPNNLAQPNFATVLGNADAAVQGLIGNASKASRDERRACALIVVEGVRLYLASVSFPDWAELARKALAEKKIKINGGDNFNFRVVANLLFRGVTKVRDDSQWADTQIGHSQITRYAQAMAWAYEKVTKGSPLESVADAVVGLGGVRKAAEVWANAQSHRCRIDSETASSREEPEVAEGPAPDYSAADIDQLGDGLDTGTRLRIIGKVTLEQPLDGPRVCVLYADGRLAEAPLPVAAMTSMVAQWEAAR